MLAWTRELTSHLRSGHHCQHAAARTLMGVEAWSRLFDPPDRCVQAVVFSMALWPPLGQEQLHDCLSRAGMSAQNLFAVGESRLCYRLISCHFLSSSPYLLQRRRFNIASLHHVINRDLQAQCVSSSRLQIIYGCCELEPSKLSAVADKRH